MIPVSASEEINKAALNWIGGLDILRNTEDTSSDRTTTKQSNLHSQIRIFTKL
jgi:hypothetical protein